ncbi:ABC transporter ATP-binding protein [Bacillus sp. DX1.1]|uniref:ABC transporter ATP-binding protein n=1 Tax=unclassified Bacillus (in: firmicutes) TaxID=185979 RepID=UPI002570A73D|nr:MULTISPECIES: ABC transporter ATP-binding protein [unclassified Bacillus (in: firmicutes)]MDM5154331.1 ABC transporter ATP-binding protein [Bacillus sp. DX1.1]WJE83242.1 ABC transporter ATP-binding protein [Bacillus sp. DX3.1]
MLSSGKCASGTFNVNVPKKATKKAILKAVNLSKTYGNGEEQFHAAKNINVEMYEGDFTVIMGSSGSGKSTLLYLLSGLDSVTEGEVYFKGKRIDSYSEHELAQFRAAQIGYVYQAVNLIPDLTIFENVVLPGYIAKHNKNEIKKKALSLIESMGIQGQQNRLPSQVSGGQQQRAAIARALINSPDVIFADEPTGALSHEQGVAILDILSEMNRNGQSVVMVTHDIYAACRAERLILVKDGTIGGTLELGKYKPEEIQSRKNAIFSFISKGE